MDKYARNVPIDSCKCELGYCHRFDEAVAAIGTSGQKAKDEVGEKPEAAWTGWAS